MALLKQESGEAVRNVQGTQGVTEIARSSAIRSLRDGSPASSLPSAWVLPRSCTVEELDALGPVHQQKWVVLCTDVSSSTPLGKRPGSPSYQLGISLAPRLPRRGKSQGSALTAFHLPASHCCLPVLRPAAAPSPALPGPAWPRGWFLRLLLARDEQNLLPCTEGSPALARLLPEHKLSFFLFFFFFWACSAWRRESCEGT